MRARPVAVAACAVIALVTLAAAPGLGGDRAGLDRMLASLPEADLAAPHALLRYRGASRADAEALFADSLAAAYVEDTAEVLVLRAGDPDVPPVGLAVAAPRGSVVTTPAPGRRVAAARPTGGSAGAPARRTSTSAVSSM